MRGWRSPIGRATYGYNLFLYPYKTWLLGPFDLFIEHGHRLLGAVVGIVAIAIVVVAYLREPRRWVWLLAVGLLVAVIAQGVLGGMRVVLGDRTLGDGARLRGASLFRPLRGGGRGDEPDVVAAAFGEGCRGSLDRLSACFAWPAP